MSMSVPSYSSCLPCSAWVQASTELLCSLRPGLQRLQFFTPPPPPPFVPPEPTATVVVTMPIGSSSHLQKQTDLLPTAEEILLFPS